MTKAALERLGSKRESAKIWVNIVKDNVKTILDKEDVTISELENAIKSLEIRLNTLDEIQTEYESKLEDSDAVLADITAANEFLQEPEQVRASACEKLRLLTIESTVKQDDVASVVAAQSIAAYSGINQTQTVKLPKFEIP